MKMAMACNSKAPQTDYSIQSSKDWLYLTFLSNTTLSIHVALAQPSWLHLYPCFFFIGVG
jgi:hypothetical protein